MIITEEELVELETMLKAYRANEGVSEFQCAVINAAPQLIDTARTARNRGELIQEYIHSQAVLRAERDRFLKALKEAAVQIVDEWGTPGEPGNVQLAGVTLRVDADRDNVEVVE